MDRHVDITKLWTSVLLLAMATSVQAQTSDTPATDADAISAICTDRPTKSNAACVVDEGHFQYEADLANFTHLKVDGTTTDSWLASNPTFKYGLARNLDLEVNVAPWQVIRTRASDGTTSTVRGVGDTFLRVKWKFLSDADDKLSASALPYVKAPTARHGIGNGAIEGGVLLPVNYQLTDQITLALVPEFDALKGSSRAGRHFNTSQIVNIGYALPNNVTVYGELWGNWNVDPAGTVRQYSADAAVTWGISRTLQVDVGFNFGLNRSTPSVQAYVGLSQKF